MSGYDFTRSVSQRRTYRACGMKWYNRYVSGWNPKTKKAQLQFGSIFEQVCGEIITQALTSPEAAQARFLSLWEPYRMDPKLTYRKGLTWKTFTDRGQILVLHAYVKLHEIIDSGAWYQLQKELRYEIGGAKELCYLDFCGYSTAQAPWGWGFGILDFKTGERTEPETLAEKDDQLTDYQLAVETVYEKKVEWLALFRGIWTTEPKVQLIWSPARTEQELARFAAEAVVVDQQIKDGVFLENPAQCHQWGGCEYQPVCFVSQKQRLEQELEQDPKKAGGAGNEELEV